MEEAFCGCLQEVRRCHLKVWRRRPSPLAQAPVPPPLLEGLFLLALYLSEPGLPSAEADPSPFLPLSLLLWGAGVSKDTEKPLWAVRRRGTPGWSCVPPSRAGCCRSLGFVAKKFDPD